MAWVNSASTSMLLNSSSLISGRFDRRIHRLSDISSVAAFEVDHPATVAGKLAALVRNCRQTCVFWRSISIGGLVETLESERFDSGSLEFGSDAVCKGREPFNLDSAPVRNLDLSPVPQPHVDPYAGLGGYAHPRMFVQTMASLRRARLQTGRVTSCLGQLCLWVVTIVPLIGIWGCTGSVSGPGQSVPPPSTTYSISGTISPNAGGSGATVTLSGAASATTTTNTSGSYTFTGLVNGTYAVTPSNTGYTFSPGSQSVTISGSNVIGVNFTATGLPGTTYSISGTISPNAGGSGATVTLSGAASATTTTNTSGSYTFTGLVNGTYAVTPSNTGYTFSPGSQSVTISGSNVIGVNFTATGLPGTTYSISGTISPNAGGSGATVTLSGAASATTTTNTSGSYTFTGLVNGTYAVTPSNTGYTFSPGSQSVTISGSNVIGLNFTATAPVAHSVTLNWSGSSSSVVGYNIYRSPVSGGPYTKMNSSVITLLTYTDTTVQAGQVYYYVVTSMNSNNVESSYSNELSATIPTP